MSRRLLTTTPQFVPGNTSAVLLTCPAGHKYEVLDFWASSDGTAGRNLALLLTKAAGGTAFVTLPVAATPPFLLHDTYGAVVLQPGDFLTGFAFGAGFAGSGMTLTYVDVNLL